MTEKTEPKHVALFSGGHDSLVNAHYCMGKGYTDKILHIDTGIGIPETQEFVREVCEQYNWDYEIIGSDHSYEEMVLENGFPGAGAHGITYIRLKDRALQEYSTRVDGKPHYYTGIRQSESDRRMRTTTTERVEEAKQYYWHSEIIDWSEDQVRDYMEASELPQSPVKQTYHHSGECLCGAFANREEELTILQAHYPEVAERIRDLEQRVQKNHPETQNIAWWGHNNMPDKELRALKAESSEEQQRLEEINQRLCRDCGVNHQDLAQEADEDD